MKKLALILIMISSFAKAQDFDFTIGGQYEDTSFVVTFYLFSYPVNHQGVTALKVKDTSAVFVNSIKPSYWTGKPNSILWAGSDGKIKASSIDSLFINWGQIESAPSFLTSYTETDPLVGTHIKAITTGNIATWTQAFNWGNHAAAGYLTSFTETDPNVGSHIKSITTGDISTWNAAFSWGNHTGLYKSISYAPTWTEVTSKPTFATVATSGSYNDLTDKPTLKRIESYSGSTDGSGAYTVTFSTSYTVAPNVQASIPNQSATNQFVRVSSVSATGFTINVFARNSINLLGTDVLLFTTTNVSSATVDVLVVEK